MAVISWWIWSRSNGVMKVLCSSAMVSCVTLSAARSAASMRCACASSSLKVPIIAASSRLPSTMRVGVRVEQVEELALAGHQASEHCYSPVPSPRDCSAL